MIQQNGFTLQSTVNKKRTSSIRFQQSSVKNRKRPSWRYFDFKEINHQLLNRYFDFKEINH